MKSIRQMSCGRLRKKCGKKAAATHPPKKDTENEGTEGGGVGHSKILISTRRNDKKFVNLACASVHGEGAHTTIVARKTYQY